MNLERLRTGANALNTMTSKMTSIGNKSEFLMKLFVKVEKVPLAITNIGAPKEIPTTTFTNNEFDEFCNNNLNDSNLSVCTRNTTILSTQVLALAYIQQSRHRHHLRRNLGYQ